MPGLAAPDRNQAWCIRIRCFRYVSSTRRSKGPSDDRSLREDQTYNDAMKVKVLAMHVEIYRRSIFPVARLSGHTTPYLACITIHNSGHNARLA